jgi:hypothetical protein
MKSSATRTSQVLRYVGCGAGHPDHRPTLIPGEVTACGDCWERADADPMFDLLLALALLGNKPIHLKSGKR